MRSACERESSSRRREMPDAKVGLRSLFSAEMHRRVRVNSDRSRVPTNYVRCEPGLWVDVRNRLSFFSFSFFVKQTGPLLYDYRTVFVVCIKKSNIRTRHNGGYIGAQLALNHWCR